MDTVWQILVIVLLTAIGGLFAASEMALVSLREGQVRALSEQGRRGAALARLVAVPTRYLATIQVGVTLAGFLSAAFGAQALSEPVAQWLESLGMAAGAADTTAFLSVTLIITYVSLVFAELVPKRLAQQRAASYSLFVARPLLAVSSLFRPVIALLSGSTEFVVKVFGGGHRAADGMSHAELRSLLLTEGVLTQDERRLIDEVFGAGGLQVREVMVPRTEVTFVRASTPVRRVLPVMVSTGYSRYPVTGRDADDVVGVVHIRDAAAALLRGEGTSVVSTLTRDVLRVPGTKPVLAALADMRQRRSHLAIVVDEYGGTAGIVTLEDLVEEVVGDIRDESDREAPDVRTLAGGVLEVEGLLNLEDFADRTGIRLPEGPYETVAGFITARIGRLAAVGDAVDVGARVLEVVLMDGRRVERVRVRAATSASAPVAEESEEQSGGVG